MENASRNAKSAFAWIEEGARFPLKSGHEIFYRRAGSGAAIVLLHGFPTWSYDYASVADDLQRDFDTVCVDFLGYGASDKPTDYDFSVPGSADNVEELLGGLGIGDAHILIHDYGGIVGQELLDRHRRGRLSFGVKSVSLMNSGFVYSAYRPTLTQKLLAMPVIGKLIASRTSKDRVYAGVKAVCGDHPPSEEEFEQIWIGMSRDDGHKLAYKHIRYNKERAAHADRWEEALYGFDGPLQLIWGLEDPVSGAHVLSAARPKLQHARIVELPGVGHFPPVEAPGAVAAAIREFLE